MSLINAPSLKRTKRFGVPRNYVNHLAASSHSSKAKPNHSQTKIIPDNNDNLVNETLSSDFPSTYHCSLSEGNNISA